MRTKRDVEDYCLLSKVHSEHQASRHLIPQRASPWIPTWLLVNIRLSPDASPMIGWTIVVGCTQNQG